MRGRIEYAAAIGVLLCASPLLAQLQFTYDYTARPHTPQSDSAQSYSYDANGNLVRRTNRTTGAAQNFQYNPANQIEKAVESGVEYRYDTAGTRIAKIRRNTSGVITQIERYFGLIETDGTNRKKYYFFGSRRIAEKTQTGTLTYHHSDHLNSATVATNATGGTLSRLDFYEFGALKSEEGTGGVIKYAYTGQEKDPETNLYNYNARMYNSVIGKFTTPDSLIPDPTNPQSLNRYAYVKNNPLGRVDPTGHADQDKGGGVFSMQNMKNWGSALWQATKYDVALAYNTFIGNPSAAIDTIGVSTFGAQDWYQMQMFALMAAPQLAILGEGMALTRQAFRMQAELRRDAQAFTALRKQIEDRFYDFKLRSRETETYLDFDGKSQTNYYHNNSPASQELAEIWGDFEPTSVRVISGELDTARVNAHGKYHHYTYEVPFEELVSELRTKGVPASLEGNVRYYGGLLNGKGTAEIWVAKTRDLVPQFDEAGLWMKGQLVGTPNASLEGVLRFRITGGDLRTLEELDR